MPPSILLIDNHDSFTHNLAQWLAADADGTVEVVRNDAITLKTVLAKQPAGLVLSPGPGHPANPDDLGVCHDILTHTEQIRCPILGVCLGMQALAAYSGASIVQAPSIQHGKPSLIEMESDSILFSGLTSPQMVMRYHSWCVEPESLSPQWRITARTRSTLTEPSVLMAIENPTQKHVGVQFHPESVGTPEGRSMLQNFLVYCGLRVAASNLVLPV